MHTPSFTCSAILTSVSRDLAQGSLKTAECHFTNLYLTQALSLSISLCCFNAIVH